MLHVSFLRSLLACFVVLYPALTTSRTFADGTHVCDASDSCAGDRIDIASDSAFSLRCNGEGACEGATIVVHSGSSFLQGGIRCEGTEACRGANITVYSSNLRTNTYRYLACSSSDYYKVCKYLQLTLVDSQLKLVCESGTSDCANVVVHLYGSSTLELVNNFKCDNKATIYLYDDSLLIDDNEVDCYSLVTVEPTTSTSTTQPPSPTSTRMTTPNPTSTSEPTSTTTAMPTTTATKLSSTRPSLSTELTSQLTTTISELPFNETTATPIVTDADDSSGNALAVGVYGVIGGAVVVLFCLMAGGCYYCRGKQEPNKEEDEEEADGSTEAMINMEGKNACSVTREPSAESCDINEEEEKTSVYVTAGGPDTEELCLSSTDYSD